MSKKAKEYKNKGNVSEAKIELIRMKEKSELVLDKERELVEAEKLKSTTIRATDVDTRVEDLKKGIEEQ
jgi:hypothetical protein